MRKGLKKLCVTVLSVTMITSAAPVTFVHAEPAEGAENEYILPVFETSDVHGFLLDISSGNEATYQYRLAYIADKVNDARTQYGQENIVLVDGGDIYQGNIVSNFQNGAPMAAAYDLMDYDAVTIGNHEFDWGYETVIDPDATMKSYSVGSYEGDSQVPVLSSNLYQNGEKVTFSKDYTVVEKTATNSEGEKVNVKVGIIGFEENYSDSINAAKFRNLGFTIREDYDALEKLAEKLETEEGCDATILICHKDASEIAGKLKEDSAIDLVCGGHSHVSQSGEVHGKTYIQPTNQATAYGYAELEFQTDENGKITSVDVPTKQTVSVTADKTKLYDTEENKEELDETLIDLAKVSADNISDVLNQKLGYVTKDITLDPLGEDTLSSTAGNWTASLMARSVGADVGVINNKGIRFEIRLDEGVESKIITAGDVYTMLPFGNKIYTYELTYQDLLDVFQYIVSEGKMSASGMDFYYTDGAVHTMAKQDGTVVYQNGKWLDSYENKTIKVAVNEHMATKYEVFAKWNDTEKLLDYETIDNEGAVRVLEEEAKASGGYLYVDADKHMINGTYKAKEEPADPGKKEEDKKENGQYETEKNNPSQEQSGQTENTNVKFSKTSPTKAVKTGDEERTEMLCVYLLGVIGALGCIGVQMRRKNS